MLCPGASDGRDEEVYDQLRAAYPLPINRRDGCGSELSNLIHLHVCWLELGATSLLLGRPRAESLLRAKRYYRAVYRTVLDEEGVLASLFGARLSTVRCSREDLLVSDALKAGDVVEALDDGQRFRVETVLDYGEVLVAALDGSTAGETGVVMIDEVRLVDRS